jgi:hypothetical protein
VPAFIKLHVKHIVNRVVLLGANVVSAPLQGLAMEDAKQPRPNLCATFEAIEGLQEDHKHFLNQILCGIGIVPHTTRGPEQSAAVSRGDNGQRIRFAPSQSQQKFRVG